MVIDAQLIERIVDTEFMKVTQLFKLFKIQQASIIHSSITQSWITQLSNQKRSGLCGMLLLACCITTTATASELSNLAASLQPGEWAQLDTQGFTGLMYTSADKPGDDPNGGNRIIDFAESGTWDPATRKFMFLGAPHGRAWRFIIYDDASNTWTSGPLPHACMANGSGPPENKNPDYCGGHAFDWNTFDHVSGRFITNYWKFGPEFDIYHPSTNQWSRSGTPPADIANLLPQDKYRYGAMEWFPELNSLMTVVGGIMLRINVDTNQWERLPEKYEMGNYHNIMQYSPVQKVIVFGGGNNAQLVANRDIYRMDAQGVVTKLTNAPYDIRISDGQVAGQPGSLITDDPVSGKFLIMNKAKAFYELDAVANSWRRLPDSPISGHAVSAAVSNYGVVMYVTEFGVWVYKHNEACQNCQIPATPTGVGVTIN